MRVRAALGLVVALAIGLAGCGSQHHHRPPEMHAMAGKVPIHCFNTKIEDGNEVCVGNWIVGP